MIFHSYVSLSAGNCTLNSVTQIQGRHHLRMPSLDMSPAESWSLFASQETTETTRVQGNPRHLPGGAGVPENRGNRLG